MPYHNIICIKHSRVCYNYADNSTRIRSASSHCRKLNSSFEIKISRVGYLTREVIIYIIILLINDVGMTLTVKTENFYINFTKITKMSLKTINVS
jgi:hypothetical protein